jgi:hypothetical protein
MPWTWRDPDDVTPGARRTPREINAWRSYDPLRRMLVHTSSGITTAHIQAADKLRELVDVATLGYTADRPLIFIANTAQPRTGMTPAAIAEVKAAREVRRVVVMFAPIQLAMIQAVILRNVTLTAWTRALPPPVSQPVEKGKLLAILEILVQHFDAAIQDELARGRRLPP